MKNLNYLLQPYEAVILLKCFGNNVAISLKRTELWWAYVRAAGSTIPIVYLIHIYIYKVSLVYFSNDTSIGRVLPNKLAWTVVVMCHRRHKRYQEIVRVSRRCTAWDLRKQPLVGE